MLCVHGIVVIAWKHDKCCRRGIATIAWKHDKYCVAVSVYCQDLSDGKYLLLGIQLIVSMRDQRSNIKSPATTKQLH